MNFMKHMTLRALGLVNILLFLAADVTLLFAQPHLESVTLRDNQILFRNGGDWKPLEEELTMPGEIKVFTNGTFQVKEGAFRLLKEGQVLRADGNLLNPDGSIQPVFDHIALSKGRVMMFKDGKGEVMTGPQTLADGTLINPDGSYTRPGGRTSRLVDGQIISLKGTPIVGLDTISLRNSKVVVFKAGAAIPLQSPEQIMGMYDGTRVKGDGLVSFQDGSSIQLTNGQIITVTGVRADF
jgi:hypothetical protein